MAPVISLELFWIGEMVTPSWRKSLEGRQVFDFHAAIGAAKFEASADQFREPRSAAEDFAITAVGKGFHAERCLSRGIRAGDQARRIYEQQASGHVARHGFAHAFGLLRAFTFGAVQGFELFFLLFQFFDDGLHRGGHERGGVVAARFRPRQILRRFRPAAK